MLNQADAELERRLNLWVAVNGGDEMRFTEASMLAYRAQMESVLAYLEPVLAGLTSAQALRASELSLARTQALLRKLEKAFTGVAVPLRLDEAIIMRLQPSLLARHATSVDRYGKAMIRQIQLELSQGFLEGVSQREMVNRLVGRVVGPRGMVSLRAVEISPGVVVRTLEELIPEGLFVRKRSWAWRIVRTEVAEAQNATSQKSYEEATETLPDMQRKIMAVLDERAAQDSLGVHGQVRALDKPFVDGAGRVYMRPPSRPNDRETLIPWRPHWPNTKRSRPLTKAEQEKLWERNEAWQAERRRARARSAA